MNPWLAVADQRERCLVHCRFKVDHVRHVQLPVVKWQQVQRLVVAEVRAAPRLPLQTSIANSFRECAPFVEHVLFVDADRQLAICDIPEARAANVARLEHYVAIGRV